MSARTRRSPPSSPAMALMQTIRIIARRHSGQSRLRRRAATFAACLDVLALPCFLQRFDDDGRLVGWIRHGLEDLLDTQRIPLIELRLLLDAFRALAIAPVATGASARGELARQRRLLPEQPQAGPQRCFELIRFLAEEDFGGIGVPDVTVEGELCSRSILPEHATAIRTGVDGGLLHSLIMRLLGEVSRNH